MQVIQAATRRKQRITLLLAFAASCIFGRMGFVAAASAFENPAPASFDQLAWLWHCLHWLIPALLIGQLLTRSVMASAAGIGLASGFVLLALNVSSLVPEGAHMPESMVVWGMATELAIDIAALVAAALVTRMIYLLAVDYRGQ